MNCATFNNPKAQPDSIQRKTSRMPKRLNKYLMSRYEMQDLSEAPSILARMINAEFLLKKHNPFLNNRRNRRARLYAKG
jgi:hypothetical protein